MAKTSPSSYGDESWFPPWFIWCLFVLTSALRVYYVLQPKNWWIMHPDEVYQALEEAHSEFYGYGFRAYEYNGPPVVDENLPYIRQQELTHGMFALRSFLLPHAYVMVTWVLQLVGLHFTPFLTWKVAHALAASTLPLAVYRYTTVVFRSRDTACLAAILCAACAQLHVLGTHTLVNSLLAPPVFLILSHIHGLVRPARLHSDEKESVFGGKITKNGVPVEFKNGTETNTGLTAAACRNGFTNGSVPKAGLLRNRGNRGKHKPSHKAGNGHLVHLNGSTSGRDVSTSNGHVSCFPAVVENGHGHSSMNGDRNGFSHSMHGGRKSAGSSASASQNNCSAIVLRVTTSLGAGLVLGVCVYVRIDIVALVVVALLPHWNPFRTRYLDVTVCACGALLGVAVGVVEDFRCYGWGVLTPYNWYMFNVEKDYSSVLFGTNDFYKYVEDIFCQNFGMVCLTIASFACGVWSAYSFLSNSSVYSKVDPQDRQVSSSSWSPVLRVFASWLVLLTIYSSKGHKELRFVHNVIVLVLITCAAFLQSALRGIITSHKTQTRILAAGVALFVLSQWHDVSSLTDNSGSGGNKMAFKKAGDTQDVNQCLYYLSSRSDVTGVFIDRNLYSTGGYTLLHHDVPVFSFFGNNFHEYRPEGRLRERAKNLLGPSRNISVAYVALFSNYLSWQSSQHVVKFVLEDPSYNYLVVFAKRDFSNFGLGQPVHHCGRFKVYRRPRSPSLQQQQMMRETINAPLNHNSTVLTHEADMLFYHGAWARAQQRFQLALQVDPTWVSAYLPIAVCYLRLGNETGYIQTMEECFDKFGESECQKQRPAMISFKRFV